MDSDEDDVSPTPPKKAKRVKFSSSACDKKKPQATKVAVGRRVDKTGDVGEYMREKEAERRYFFDYVHRLAKERTPGDTTPLRIPPWTWSENARKFQR